MGHGSWDFGTQNYGNQWRESRRLFHTGVNQSEVKRYKGLQIRSAHAFVKQLRNGSDNVQTLIRQYVPILRMVA